METAYVENITERAFGISLGGGQITIHSKSDCEGPPCPFHSPTDHHMREWPTTWRGDRGLLERIYSHGVGHPDPDDRSEDKTHGCDGCCNPPLQERQMPTTEKEVRKSINFLFQKNGNFTLKDVQENLDNYKSTVGVILMNLANHDEIVRISRGLYTLPEGQRALSEVNVNGSIYGTRKPHNPRSVTFENLRDRIIHFKDDTFTISDIRNSISSTHRPTPDDTLAVLKGLRSEGKVSNTGSGYWAKVKVTQSEKSEPVVDEKKDVTVPEDPGPTEQGEPRETLSFSWESSDVFTLVSGEKLHIAPNGDIFVTIVQRVGNIHEPQEL